MGFRFIKFNKKRHRVVRSGFSLIELMVTIGIIGLLSTISVVSINGARTNARDSKRMNDMRQLATALDMYAVDNGVYPDCDANSRDGEGSAWYTCLGAALTGYISPMPADPSGLNGYGYSYKMMTNPVNGHKGAYVYFGLEDNRPNMSSASFGWYNGTYGQYMYSRIFGSYN